MPTHNMRLSSSEVNGLWNTFILETASVCFLKYFKQHMKDPDILDLIKKALVYSEEHIKQIRGIFREERFPIPHGFTDEDIDLSAPQLFHDLFGLSYIYAMGRMGMIGNSFITSSVARMDVREFFTRCLEHTTELYNLSTTLMLEKGVYDRPPMINYPSEVTYIDNNSLLIGYMSKRRPLNVMELTEIFLNIERNNYGVILCVGLLQVVKDKEIKAYIQEGMDICKKQIKLFNLLLLEQDLLGSVPPAMDVTESTRSPFSDRLIMYHFSGLNSIDITLLGHALSMSLRNDIAGNISKLITEILKYGKKGIDLMVSRRWMEKPPEATDRKALFRK